MGAVQVDWAAHVDVVDMITELVDRHSHREPVERDRGTTRVRTGHVTEVRPLLEQLQVATPTSTSGDDTAPHGGGFESQPAAHLESMDTILLIDQEASLWVRRARVDDAGLTTAECVRKVGALMAGMAQRGDRCHRFHPLLKSGLVVCCTWHAAERDVRRWWAQARIVSGWDSPAWRPDATCPACNKRGGLRIRLSAKVGVCVECRETWDPATIGLLAEHIRAESFSTARAGRREPCWCPWPTPVDRIGGLCPSCASARCHRAIMANLGRAGRPAAS